jgi:hypothetical protein
MDTFGKVTFGALAIAATLAFSGLASTPAAAEAVNGKVGAKSARAAGDTDFSSQHWRYRRYGYVRPRIYRYRYGYYRPRPYYYASPYAVPYRPVYYRPYYAPAPYYAPGPYFGVGFGFGPRHYW